MSDSIADEKLSCCISLCRNYKNPYAAIDLYSLPEDADQRIKFCKILSIPVEESLKTTARVCALHFRSKVSAMQKPPFNMSEMDGTASLENVDQSVAFSDIKSLSEEASANSIYDIGSPQVSSSSNSVIITSDEESNHSWSLASTPNVLSNDSCDFVEILDEKSGNFLTVKDVDEDKNVDLCSPTSETNEKSCTSETGSLQLVCEEDSLNSSQLELYMKNLMDFVAANEVIRRFPPSTSNHPLLTTTYTQTDCSMEQIITVIPQNLPLVSTPGSSIQGRSTICEINKNPVVPPPESLLSAVLSQPKHIASGVASSSNSSILSQKPIDFCAGVPQNSPSLAKIAMMVSSANTTTCSSAVTPSYIYKNPPPYSSAGSVIFQNRVLAPKVLHLPPPINAMAALRNPTFVPNGSYNSSFMVRAPPMPTPVTNFYPFSTVTGISNSNRVIYTNCGFFPNMTSSSLQDLPVGSPVQIASPVRIASPVQMASPTVPPDDRIRPQLVSSIHFPVPTDNDLDKDADLLGLCNVATVYGADTPPASSTPEVTCATTDKISIIKESNTKTSSGRLESTARISVAGKTLVVDKDSKVGPYIVDVLSAIEGGKECFVGDKIPDNLYDNLKISSKCRSDSSADSAPKHKKKKIACATDEDEEIEVDDPLPPEQQVKIQVKSAVASHSSIFSLQFSIPVIPNGTAIYQDSRKLFCVTVPPKKNKEESAELLRNLLRNEKYITGSVWWLAQRHVLPVRSPCSLCGGTVYVLHRNKKFFDGFCWTCDNPQCRSQEPVKRPKFFERFTFYSLEDLLLLTFHWACQTPMEDVFQDVNMDSEKIWTYFKALQKLCQQVSEKKTKLGSSSKVEAAVVKMGHVFIFGALDRKSQNVRLEVIPTEKAMNSSCHIDLLEKWLYPKAVLITEKMLPNDVMPGIYKLRCKTVNESGSILATSDKDDAHIQNILNYLTRNMLGMFGKMNQKYLPIELIENYIYELEWREKYAKSVDMAFWSIINHIRELNITPSQRYPRTTVKHGDLAYASYICQLTDNLKKRWVPRSVKDAAAESSLQNKTINPFASPITKSYSRLTEDLVKNLNAVSSKVSNIKELFQSIPEVQGGFSFITSRSLLAIKIRFDEIACDRDLYKSDCICLGLKLRQEGFISNPVKWLVKKGFVKNSSPCYVCKQVSLLRENHRFSDGCSWLCQNPKCKFENNFKRPHFFAIFAEYSMAHVAAMIFHWTVQSDIEIITSDAPMDSTKISHAWRSFQLVCSTALKRDKFRLGGEDRIVEVAIIKFGRLYILGAMDRKTKKTCLRSFPINLLLQVERFYRTLYSWINAGSYVVIDSSQQFQLPNSFFVVVADNTIQDKNSVNFHILNITSYLQKHISSMFGHLKPGLLGCEMAQIFMEELMWRERFGKFPQLAFAKIMHEIFYLEKHGLYPHQYTFGKGVLMDEPTVPPKLKEVRVVLHRIPETVLKYYNCLPPGYNSESSKYSSKGKPQDDSDDDDEPQFIEVRAVVHKPPSEVIDLIDDDDEMVDVETIEHSKNNSSTNSDVQCDNIKVEKPDAENREKASSKEPPPKNNELTQEPTRDIPSVQPKDKFVPPLVIRTSKKRRKIIIMSKICDTELVPNDGSMSSEEFSVHKKSDGLETSQKCLPSCQAQNTVEEELDKPSSSKLHKKRSVVLRRLYGDNKRACIECGENAGVEHFTKQFSCADCKTTIYSTYCSNAFFEHRGSLLFGKRMPRRGKEHIGIHRPMPLLNTWYCSCGFNSRHGNAIASHLVKCKKNICYQWDVS